MSPNNTNDSNPSGPSLISLVEPLDGIKAKHRQVWETHAFKEAVAHFERFDLTSRKQLQEHFNAFGHTPWALAAFLCLHPEVLPRHAGPPIKEASEDPRAEALFWVERMVLEHDFGVDLSDCSKETRGSLHALGLLPTPLNQDQHYALPALLACMLSSYTEGLRPSLALMCGEWPDERVVQMAKCFGLRGPTSPMVVALMMEMYFTEEVPAKLINAVSDPNYLCWALMVLELGGLCFWEEVFGPSEEDGVNVLSLGEPADLAFEKAAIVELLQCGVLLRREGNMYDDRVMLVVPEDVIPGLWSLGQRWRADFVRAAMEDLESTGRGQEVDAPRLDLMHSRLKWLVCESLCEAGLHLPPRVVEMRRLGEVSQVEDESIRQGLEWGVELGVFVESASRRVMCDVATATKVLGPSGREFEQQMLYLWCTGELGANVDVSLTQAIGLDESWRQQILNMQWHRQSDRLPAWLLQEGIAPELTGSGFLRVVEHSAPSQLLTELSLVNSYIWSTKLLWLDLLSLLKPNTVYQESTLQHLLLQCATHALFEHLAHVLDGPGEAQYLPVQRVTLLCEPLYMERFERWGTRIVDQMLVPLGLARRCEGRGVWLKTKSLRVKNPPGMFEEHRQERLEALLGPERISTWSVAPSQGPGLMAMQGGRSVRSEVPERFDLSQTSLELLTSHARQKNVSFYGDGCISFKEV